MKGGDLSIVRAYYTNHRGENSLRTFRPTGKMWFGCTAFHPEAQWLIEVFDLDRQETRDYAMAGFTSPWTRARE